MTVIICPLEINFDEAYTLRPANTRVDHSYNQFMISTHHASCPSRLSHVSRL